MVPPFENVFKVHAVVMLLPQAALEFSYGAVAATSAVAALAAGLVASSDESGIGRDEVSEAKLLAKMLEAVRAGDLQLLKQVGFHACLCVHRYSCHVCMCIYIYTHMYTHIYRHVCIHTCIHMYVYTHTTYI